MSQSCPCLPSVLQYVGSVITAFACVLQATTAVHTCNVVCDVDPVQVHVALQYFPYREIDL